VDPFSTSTPVQVSNRSWVERSTLSRPPSPIPLRANDIDEQIEARLAPFMWKAILDTRVLIAEDLGAAPTPLVLAQVEC
jgi:hypothetical protein